MERATHSKNNILTNLMDSYQIARSRPQFKVFPQMPIHQILHYIKQSARLEKNVIIQINPSTYTNHLSEVYGIVKLSPRSEHIIVSNENDKTVHLIHPEQIRHLRIA